MESMKAVEYNTWMSMLNLISRQIPTLAPIYGISATEVDVIPSYPKDLSKFHKPSIIVQRVSTSNNKVGMGNVLGRYYDEVENAYHDVFGSIHNITFQINIDARSNTECSLMSSMIVEGIINRTAYDADDRIIPVLYDYTGDVKNPVEMGIMAIDLDIDQMDMSSNRNQDYITSIRVDVSIIQHVIPHTDMVDLSKGIKYKQTIKL